MLTLTHNLCREFDYARSGVMPYTVIDDNVHFLCALDGRTKDLTDFGGGVKSRESALEAALREFEEESVSAFFPKMYNSNTWSDTFAVNDKKRKMSIIFIPFSGLYAQYVVSLFNRARCTAYRKKNTEIESILWVRQDKFYDIAFNKENKDMWARIQNFFIANIATRRQYNTFINALKNIYDRKLYFPAK